LDRGFSFAEVMDLTRNFFMSLGKSLERFEGRAGPGTWACAIALNTANVYTRKIFLRERTLREYLTAVLAILVYECRKISQLKRTRDDLTADLEYLLSD
jgi:DNA-directed RNA polymerase specialized sigma24 family protein